MRAVQSVTHVARGRGAPPTHPHLRGIRTPAQLHTDAYVLLMRGSNAASSLPTALYQSRRCLSQQASRWLDRLRYGADDAPTLGSWENAYEDNAMDTRKLYCKALVHASGGSRLARDWIAGCAALTSPDPSLIYTALQHTATAADVEALRAHFLDRLLSEGDASVVRGGRRINGRHSGGESGERPAGGRYTQDKLRNGDAVLNGDITVSFENAEEEKEMVREVLRVGEDVVQSDPLSSSSAEVGKDGSDSTNLTAAYAKRSEEDDVDGNDDGSILPESIHEAESLLLSRSPEVRCFMYDAMTASLFHSNYDLRTVEAARRHTFWIGANVFGISFDELTLLWRVVEAELLLKKEKIKVLGQPWSE